MLGRRAGVKVALFAFAALFADCGAARAQEGAPQRGAVVLAAQESAGDASLPHMVRHHLQQVLVPHADVFVATNGCDTCNWSGGLATPNAAGTDGPFATIPRAQSAVQRLEPSRASGPITVMIRAGTYYLQQPLVFVAGDSGSSAVPIVWQAYPDEMPVINGGVRVTGWTNISGNLWRATFPLSAVPFENVFVNGERRLRPRVGADPGNTIGTFLRVASEVYSPVSTPKCPPWSAARSTSASTFFCTNPATRSATVGPTSNHQWAAPATLPRAPTPW